MPFFDEYETFRVAVTIHFANKKPRRMTPEVANMRTAHSIGMKMKKQLGGKDYTIFRLANEKEMKEFTLGKLKHEDSEFFRKAREN